jgi:hypothetical protein
MRQKGHSASRSFIKKCKKALENLEIGFTNLCSVISTYSKIKKATAKKQQPAARNLSLSLSTNEKSVAR